MLAACFLTGCVAILLEFNLDKLFLSCCGSQYINNWFSGHRDFLINAFLGIMASSLLVLAASTIGYIVEYQKILNKSKRNFMLTIISAQRIKNLKDYREAQSKLEVISIEVNDLDYSPFILTKTDKIMSVKNLIAELRISLIDEKYYKLENAFEEMQRIEDALRTDMLKMPGNKKVEEWYAEKIITQRTLINNLESDLIAAYTAKFKVLLSIIRELDRYFKSKILNSDWIEHSAT